MDDWRPINLDLVHRTRQQKNSFVNEEQRFIYRCAVGTYTSRIMEFVGPILGREFTGTGAETEEVQQIIAAVLKLARGRKGLTRDELFEMVGAAARKLGKPKPIPELEQYTDMIDFAELWLGTFTKEQLADWFLSMREDQQRN